MGLFIKICTLALLGLTSATYFGPDSEFVSDFYVKVYSRCPKDVQKPVLDHMVRCYAEVKKAVPPEAGLYNNYHQFYCNFTSKSLPCRRLVNNLSCYKNGHDHFSENDNFLHERKRQICCSEYSQGCRQFFELKSDPEFRRKFERCEVNMHHIARIENKKRTEDHCKDLNRKQSCMANELWKHSGMTQVVDYMDALFREEAEAFGCHFSYSQGPSTLKKEIENYWRGMGINASPSGCRSRHWEAGKDDHYHQTGRQHEHYQHGRQHEHYQSGRQHERYQTGRQYYPTGRQHNPWETDKQDNWESWRHNPQNSWESGKHNRWENRKKEQQEHDIWYYKYP